MTTSIAHSSAQFDIGIYCDTLVNPKDSQSKTVEVKRNVFIGIQKNKISFIGDGDRLDFSPREKCQKFIEGRNHICLPGLINAHTHLPMSLFRGLADDLPFEEWLFDYIIPLENALVDENFIRTGMKLALMESIRFGVTTFQDMYFFPNVALDVFDEMGVRGRATQVFTQYPMPDDSLLGRDKTAVLNSLRERTRNHSRLSLALGPHAPYTCDDEILRFVQDYSVKNDLPIHIHVAETQKEITESVRQYQKTPVARLHQLGITGSHVSYAHGVHLTEDDIEILKTTKTSIVYNPESNMKLGSGSCPAAKLFAENISVGLGTDGAASNNDLSLFREMDTGVKLQKLIYASNTALTAAQILYIATLGGAKALGLDSITGSIELGKRADLILVDTNFLHLQPIHDPVSALVYSTSGPEVDTVICDGKVLLENKTFPSHNPSLVIEEAKEWQRRIQNKLPR